MVEEAQTDEGAGQVEKSLEQVSPPFIADAEAAAAKQAGEAAFDHPAMAAQPLTGIDSTSRDARDDASGAQAAAKRRGIVRLVAVEFGRALAWPTELATGTIDGRNGIDERKQLS